MSAVARDSPSSTGSTVWVSSRSRLIQRTHIVIAVPTRDYFGRRRRGELRRFK